jgi:hypothetical protein
MTFAEREKRSQKLKKMPRINVDFEEVRGDVRYAPLLLEIKDQDLTEGILVRFWDMAQLYWRKGKLVPEDHFPKKWTPLITTGWAEVQEGGIYAKGGKERFAWLTSRKDAGSKGGKQTQAKRSKLKQIKQTQASSSSSSSDSKSKELPANAGNPVFFLKKYFLEKHVARHPGFEHPWNGPEWSGAKRVLGWFNANANGKCGDDLCREAIDKYIASEEPFVVNERHHFQWFCKNPLKWAPDVKKPRPTKRLTFEETKALGRQS